MILRIIHVFILKLIKGDINVGLDINNDRINLYLNDSILNFNSKLFISYDNNFDTFTIEIDKLNFKDSRFKITNLKEELVKKAKIQIHIKINGLLKTASEKACNIKKSYELCTEACDLFR